LAFELREIDFELGVAYARASGEDQRFSAPRIDWSWAQASKIFGGEIKESSVAPKPYGPTRAYAYAWLLPHVALPHIITLVIGLVLFFDRPLGFALGAVLSK
jgi:hypothetical protein